MSDGKREEQASPKMMEITLRGRVLESAESVKSRFQVSEWQLAAWRQQGLANLKLSNRRFYDRENLEQWLLDLMK